MLTALTWEAWLTLAVVVGLIVTLARDVARPELLLFASLAPLLATGVLTADEAFAGFSNSAPLAVGALFVVAAGVQATGALAFTDWLLFRRSGRLGATLGQMMLTTATLSAVLNNTPLVAMLMPRVQAWCERTGVSPSKLMIPLSYAAIVGGMTTLIGTSTNLLVAGLMEDAGLPPLGLFDLAAVGLPAAAAVIVYFALVGHRWLPDRGADDAAPVPADCLFEIRLTADSPLAGQTVEDADLRALGDAFLVHVESGGDVVPASPEAVLRAGDVLLFTGTLDALDRLLTRPGVERAHDAAEAEGLPVFEAVVAGRSPLAGRTLREVDFREQFGGVVLGIRRRDGAVHQALGRTPLREGDLLLVEAAPSFAERWGRDRDTFYVVAPVRPPRTAPHPARAATSLTILVGVIGVAALFGVSIVTTSFLGALAMVATRCLTWAEARRSVDLSVLLVIVAALGLGRAIEGSGLAAALATHVTGMSAALGPLAVVAAAYVATSLLTEIITNNAAAVLMLGVGLEAAAATGTPPEAFAVAVAIAASASFLTPVGYQTNMMVMAAGRYRFSDYLKSGAVVNLLVAAVALAMIALLWL